MQICPKIPQWSFLHYTRTRLPSPLTPCGTLSPLFATAEMKSELWKLWKAKSALQSRCLANFAFSGKFSHKSLAQTMQRQHKEQEEEAKDDDDDEEETLARDRLCDLGTPINYRKCHFKCRKSHNVHNQFRFWQICPARKPLKKREGDRKSERERGREIVARILQPPKPTRVRHLHNHNLEIVRGLISSFLASFLLSCLSHSPIAFCFQ